MLILRSLFWGILAASAALVLELVFLMGSGEPFLFQQISASLIILVLIEEFLKIILIWKNFSLNFQKSSGLQILFQSLSFGLGFALTETILGFFAFSPDNHFELATLLPFLGSILLHIGTAGLIGSILVLSKKTTFLTFWKIFLLCSVWHFLFNFFKIQNDDSCLSLILAFFLIFIVIISGFRIFFSQKTYAH
jgi:RsiW-degrading membrane proteinase PrsW (M82 family)